MFEHFLAPVDVEGIVGDARVLDNHILKHLAIHTEADGLPEAEGVHLALVGVPDDRGAANNEGCASAPDLVRKHLYLLDKGHHQLKMADLGNILPGAALSDTYFALG